VIETKQTIHKFLLPLEATGVIEITGIESVLSVAVQNNNIVLYAMINTEDPAKYQVGYAIRGTGQEADDVWHMKFMGTMTLGGGSIMLHVFVQKAWCYMA